MWARIRPAYEAVHDYWLAMCIGLCVFLIGIVMRIKHSKKPPLTLEEREMTAEGRRLHVHQVMVRRLGEAIVNAVLDDEITQQEANDELGRLGKFYDKSCVEDIVRIRKPEILKARLRNANRRRQLNGNKKPLPLPLPQPKKSKVVDPDSVQAMLEG